LKENILINFENEKFLYNINKNISTFYYISFLIFLKKMNYVGKKIN
jgi:hypothetical protein